MKEKLVAVFLLAFAIAAPAQTEKPLRVFIRAGEKTHGPGQHDHPRFLADWKALLNQRGAQADGAMSFPSAAQLEATDVLVLYAAEGGTILPEQRASLDPFLKRGGGLVVIHDAVHFNTANNPSDASRRGLVGPGSVAPYSGGPAPGPIKQRYQP